MCTHILFCSDKGFTIGGASWVGHLAGCITCLAEELGEDEYHDKTNESQNSQSRDADFFSCFPRVVSSGGNFDSLLSSGPLSRSVPRVDDVHIGIFVHVHSCRNRCNRNVRVVSVRGEELVSTFKG